MADQLSFARDIKGLFRASDREAMESHFDLWEVEDVRANSADILRTVESGEMPCDGEWPTTRVDQLRRWVTEGMPD